MEWADLFVSPDNCQKTISDNFYSTSPPDRDSEMIVHKYNESGLVKRSDISRNNYGTVEIYKDEYKK